MLTPTRREVATTAAAKVPSGAQLWGGQYDGATVRRAIRGTGPIAWAVTLLLEDGREILLVPEHPVAWLHPAGRRRS